MESIMMRLRITVLRYIDTIITMKRKLKFCLTLICLFLPGVFIANSQVLVESVAAVVGNEVIYLSDVENTVADLRRNGTKTPLDELSCKVFQQMLVSKLFMDQARIDSITVTDDQVEGDLNMRMNAVSYTHLTLPTKRI